MDLLTVRLDRRCKKRLTMNIRVSNVLGAGRDYIQECVYSLSLVRSNLFDIPQIVQVFFTMTAVEFVINTRPMKYTGNALV
jgi:hypothetical protein